MDRVQDTIDLLTMYNQEHIVKLLESFADDKKQELIEQIRKIDFHQLKELYDNTKKRIEIKENKIEPLPYLDKNKLTQVYNTCQRCIQEIHGLRNDRKKTCDYVANLCP